MLDKFSQLKQMRDMQKRLQQEEVEVAKNGVRLVLNGAFELKELTLNPELPLQEQEETLKELWNEARQKVQSILMRQVQGFGI